jgi:protein MpaA
VKRLGLNKGRYHGEGLDVAEYLREFHAAALAHHWCPEHFATIAGYELHGYHRTTASGGSARAATGVQDQSATQTPTPTIYISTGIHGDEPAGPVALRRLVEENRWPADTHFILCPCVNPTGLQLKTRENAAGIDLNRDYRSRQSPEVQAHTAWLSALPPFDLSLVLHEDWEADGYYLYEVNYHYLPSPGARIIEAVRDICPIQPTSTIDGLWQCENGIIHPNLRPEERPQWAEAMYLVAHKTKLSLTLEAPSDFPLPFRAEAHVRALHAALEQ